jgi:hypothetical protein
MAENSGTAEQLVVRQHERLRCDLAARVMVGPESAERVVLSLDGARGGNGAVDVAVRVTDCSRGGLGLQSPVYLPKRCRVMVRVEGVDGLEGASGTLELGVTVQRAAMLDRGPTYYLGTAGESEGRAMMRLMEWVRRLNRGGVGGAVGSGTAGAAGVGGAVGNGGLEAGHA